MGDVNLPWPRRRGSSDDDQQAPAGTAPPHYEIRSVMSNGEQGPVELLPITRPPWKASAGRRGFLGVGVVTSVAVALLASGCKSSSSDNPSPADSDSSGTGPDSNMPDSSTPDDTTGATYGGGGGYTSSSSGGYTSDSSDSSSGGYDTPTPDDTDNSDSGSSSDSGGGTGGYICTCNKVCTCIPVCQAHRLLDDDPGVRAMAEAVLHEMGLAELRYMQGAAAEASSAALAARIHEVIGDIAADRPAVLPTPEQSAHYLDAEDPVTALMAAQVLTLNALRRGTGLRGDRGDKAAVLLAGAHTMRWSPQVR